MKNKFSDLWSINKKEFMIGLALAVLAAIVDLLWTGMNPVIVEFTTNKIIDFTLFTGKVNLTTAWQTASMAATSYFLLIYNTGEKKDK